MSSESFLNKKKNKRYGLLDSIRGVTLISMILYHGAWDLVNLYGIKWTWYWGNGAYIWQQSICWTFIFLSGFCWPFGKRPLKRGFMVFGGGALVTAVTCLIMPENRVVFGVLTLIGSCMIFMIPLDKVLRKIPPGAGIFLSFFLFLLTRNINSGYLGFETFDLIRLPVSWYRGILMTYLGFPAPDFFSTDYFSLLPWLFLFVSGYFLHHICKKRNIFENPLFKRGIAPFSFLGRYSLFIYLIHQPILYLVGQCIFELI